MQRTIFLIGDSTVENNKAPFRGWGYCLNRYTAEGAKVDNQALSGRSTRSFLNEGLFEPVKERIGEGDLLLIQFGHNDEKDAEDLHTDPNGSFLDFLNLYCDTALEHGALPVLVTPVSRRFFVGGGFLLYTHGEYPAAMKRLAEKRQLPLIDLEAKTRELYLQLGEEKTAELFVRLRPGEHPDFSDGHDDKTHYNEYGANLVAGLVWKEMLKDSRLKGYVREDVPEVS
ncbi:MAG: rhamnogalacturonan acetylesterase [Clostridia bacterium]|nr:rhamnogalacturonan acetylesterase [Clostridia bacterium]